MSEEDGRFLRLLIASKGAQHALEIGGASGYSAIWIGMGLRETGGKLVTIEYDPVRAKELAENIRRAGLTDVVQVMAGDAFQQIPKVTGTFDFVFLDAWKKDYKRFLDLVFPRLDKGGAVPRPQRREQEERDGRLPGRDPEESVAVDDDRVAVGRRNVGVVEALRAYSSASAVAAAAAAFFVIRFFRGLPLRRPAGTGSSLGSSRDMLVRNFLTPCSSNCTRV